MADHKSLTPEQQRRLEHAPYLCLVAYFHPRPPKIGSLIAGLVALTADAVGDLRVSGRAHRRIPYDVKRHARLPQREIDRIFYHKLPNTLRKIVKDRAMNELSSGSLDSIWASQMSPHKLTGLKELIWYLTYNEKPRQFATDLDPYLHLFITMDRMKWRGMGLREFIVSFFERCAASGVCYGGLADPVRWRESMGSCYHDFTAGSVPLDRLLNDYMWIRAGRRRRRYVRGVYWGTMLPARVLRRLGGVERVRASWAGHAWRGATTAPCFIELPGNCALLTVTDTPTISGSGYFHTDLAAGAWLHSTLRDAGVLL